MDAIERASQPFEDFVKECEKKGWASATKGSVKRVDDYDLVPRDQPIKHVWIFLGTGQCLFHYCSDPYGYTADPFLVTGFFSSFDQFLEEMLNDAFNVVFAFRHAFYYNYIGLPSLYSDVSKKIVCTICVEMDEIDQALLDKSKPYKEKCAKIIMAFFEDYKDSILDFDGNTTPFSDFILTCLKIIHEPLDNAIQEKMNKL